MSRKNNDNDIQDHQASPGDPLLQCLVFLTAHYGRAKSAQALTAGLAYDENNMRPSLFCEAAQRLGLKTQIVKKTKLIAIPQSVLPAVLILKEDQACVLLDVKGKQAKIYLPDTDSEKLVDFEKLQSSANDTYVLFQQEIDWRKNFKKKHMDKINAHDKIISETIGLRLQSKLTKEQAIYVSRCNSIHRDISLNF